MSSQKDAVVPASPAAGDGRLCAFRGCRAPLPPPTGRPGNRPKYCQDARTWGQAELTCKAAEAAYLAVESLQGDAPVPPAGLPELGERLDTILATIAVPVTQLLEAVTATRAGLDEDVLAAFADRDTAQAQAAADRGAREVAEQDAARERAEAEQARTAAAEAEALHAAAVRARDAADIAAREAERAQIRAEGQQIVLEERLRRAEQLAEESADQASRLQIELAERTATLQAMEHAIEQARATERARGRELAEAHRTELRERDDVAAAERATHERRLDQLRAEQHQAITALTAELEARLAATRAKHARTLDAAQADHGAVIAQLTARHADQLAVLNRRLGAAEHELAQLGGTADEQNGQM